MSTQSGAVQGRNITLYIHNTSHSPDKAITNYHKSFVPDCTVYDQVCKNVLHTNSTISNIYIEFKSKVEDNAFLINIPDKPLFMSSLLVNQVPSVAMACGTDLSRACNKIAKTMKIFGDVAHLILSLPLTFQGNPISQSFAIRLGSSWLRKPLQHYKLKYLKGS